MLNIEKYKDAILNSEIADITCCVNELINKNCASKTCGSTPCEVCKEHAMKWLLKEYKEPLLDDAEKKYLSEVIRPFRSRASCITKVKSVYGCVEYIKIVLSDEETISFPYFKANTMYKGMELGKRYTLDELGLEEGEEPANEDKFKTEDKFKKLTITESRVEE